MGLKQYCFDGSALSDIDRQKLIDLLDRYAYTGCIFVDMKSGKYTGFF